MGSVGIRSHSIFDGLVGGFSPTHLKNMRTVRLDSISPRFGVNITNGFPAKPWIQAAKPWIQAAKPWIHQYLDPPGFTICGGESFPKMYIFLNDHIFHGDAKKISWKQNITKKINPTVDDSEIR